MGNQSQINKRFLVVALALILSFGIYLLAQETVVYATDTTAQFGDVKGHWAESSIGTALGNGYVTGYPDGTFQPNEPVTRAEFVSMFNNALQLREENVIEILFDDVAEDSWYYDEIAKASYVNYASGVGENTFAPDSTITRQDAITMMGRILPSDGSGDSSILARYSDRGTVSEYALESITVMSNKGYVSGSNTGLLNPKATLTRAEAVTIIEKLLQGEIIEREDVSIRTADTVLKDTIYVGNVTLDWLLRFGDASLQNISVLSTVYVNGGGSDTVTIDESFIVRLVVSKEGYPVRVMSGQGNQIQNAFVFNDNLFVNSDNSPVLKGTTGLDNLVYVRGTVSRRQADKIVGLIAAKASNRSITEENVLGSVQEVIRFVTTKVSDDGTIHAKVPTIKKEETSTFTIGSSPNQNLVQYSASTAAITATAAGGENQGKTLTADGEFNDPPADIYYFVGDQFIVTDFISMTPSTTIPVPNSFSNYGDDRVHDGQFEVYYGTYDTGTHIFTLTGTRSQSPYMEGATHTLILYDNDSSDTNSYVGGFVVYGQYEETTWRVGGSGESKYLYVVTPSA